MTRASLSAGLVVPTLALAAVGSCASKLPTWEDPEGSLGRRDPAGEGSATEGAGTDAATGPVPAAAGPFPKALHGAGNESCGGAPGVGTRVKDFHLPNAKGDAAISPESYRGRVVLLNFWGTWCKPCLEELPEFDRMYQHYRAHGLTLVAVATDEELGPVREFVDRHALAGEVAYQGEGLAGQYGARTFPFTFVVDGNGVIRAAYDGFKPECLGQLEQDLRSQLEKL